MAESIEEFKQLLEEQQQRIETLEAKQEKLQKQYRAAKEQNEQVLNLFEQFKSGSISRRAFLTSVSAVAGISWLAGNAEAEPNWSNAIGNSGEESKPLKNVYAQNAYHQSVSTDELIPSDIFGISKSGGNPVMVFQSEEISDGGKAILERNNGFVLITSQFDNNAIFTLKGGANSVLKVIDPNNSYTNTEDNQGTTNIYHDGSDYVIENETGTDPFSYTITFISAQ
ncbi:hypothetical protein [Haloarcula argentinensis]|uniref:Uncharacterized protein n=1 Tax=Haloarcula argentinensis TaxID=43776 RepID=A0A830FRY1_HALAR|nr:hypothetical protein [Haloarcula argentinensis]GGM52545.1 hypothetical protein GCM10009006_37120 [Haloarcula argentinensis]